MDVPQRSRIRSRTLKFRLTSLCVCASLAIGLFTGGILLHSYQNKAKSDLIASTEFNLHLVAGLIDQELSAVDDLINRCRSNTSVSSYLANPAAPPAETIQLYNRLTTDFTASRGFASVHRIIFTNMEHTRVLQFGNDLSGSQPLTLGKLDELPALKEPERYRQWTGPVDDLFSNAPNQKYLISVTPVNREFST